MSLAHDPAGLRARRGRLRVRVGTKGGVPNGTLKRRVCEYPPEGHPVSLPLSRSGPTSLEGGMVIAWTRVTPLRGSGLYCPPISEKCVAHLATQFLPAGSRKAFEMTVQRHAGADTGSRAPGGQGSDGGTGRVPPLPRWRARPWRASRTGSPWSPQRPGRQAWAGDGCQGPWTRDDERAFETPSGRTAGATPAQRRPVCVGVIAVAVRPERSSTPEDGRARA